MPSEEEDIFRSFNFLGVDDIFRSEGVNATADDINQLGLTGLGVPDFSKWSGGEGAIGAGEGEDLEDEVDLEIKDEVETPPLFSGDEDPWNSSAKRKNDAEEGPRKKRRKRKIRETSTTAQPSVEKKLDLFKDIYPSYRKDAILDFTELFRDKVIRKPRLKVRPIQVAESQSPTEIKENVPLIDIRQVAEDMIQELPRASRGAHPFTSMSLSDVDVDLRRALMARAKVDKSINLLDLPLDERSYDLVVLSDWENDIIYSASSAPPRAPVPDLQRPLNAALDSGDWIHGIIWDAKTPFKDFSALEIEQPESDDTARISSAAAPSAANATSQTEKGKDKDSARRSRKKQRSEAKQMQQQATAPGTQPQRDMDLLKDKFNLSNDRAYEVSKDGNRHRIRQTFGNLVVQHAYPAIKLQLPWYKTRLSKSEARSFHRPAVQLPINVPLYFSKVRSSKKKDKAGRKLASGDPMERLRRTSDLTLKETGQFVLLEYSEEHPPIMSNFGMGSVLVNYYRKRDEKDEHIPKLDLGEPFILEPEDDPPFLRFGSVAHGQTVPALYNNLIRAPLFRHKPYATDFLVVKTTIRGQSSYYIRDIKNLFIVGQTLPVVEVPGPNSRKISNTSKYRLQIITCKLLRKGSPKEGIKVPRLLKYFPDQGEMQMRGRLKEFMDYHRKGDHAGYWRPKPGWEVLTDAKAMELVTPENAVLYESMQVGQRHLQDAGYSRARVQAVDGKQGKLSIEQQLAPWIATKNFINATQAKSMIQIYGEGDPTGRGEGLSFIWVSMKTPFKPLGYVSDDEKEPEPVKKWNAHKYKVADQQTVYKAEIERVWQAQFKALSNKVEPELSTSNEDLDGDLFGGGKKGKSRATSLFGASRQGSPMELDGATSGRSASVFSQTVGDKQDDAVHNTGSVLRIKRLVEGKWKTEIIRDKNVMIAYMTKKEEERMMNMDLDDLAPIGDAVIDAANRKRLEEELARRQKNQDRRLQRKGANIGGPNKGDTTRKCGNCGQIGHMKTNKQCPLFAKTNGGESGPDSPPPTGAGRMSPPPPPTGRMSPVTGVGAGFGGAVDSSAYRPTLSRYPTASSPLATSPPLFPGDLLGAGAGGSTSGAAMGPPKIKLKLGTKK